MISSLSREREIFRVAGERSFESLRGCFNESKSAIWNKRLLYFFIGFGLAALIVPLLVKIIGVAVPLWGLLLIFIAIGAIVGTIQALMAGNTVKEENTASKRSLFLLLMHEMDYAKEKETLPLYAAEKKGSNTRPHSTKDAYQQKPSDLCNYLGIHPQELKELKEELIALKGCAAFFKAFKNFPSEISRAFSDGKDLKDILEICRKTKQQRQADHDTYGELNREALAAERRGAMKQPHEIYLKELRQNLATYNSAISILENLLKNSALNQYINNIHQCQAIHENTWINAYDTPPSTKDKWLKRFKIVLSFGLSAYSIWQIISAIFILTGELKVETTLDSNIIWTSGLGIGLVATAIVVGGVYAWLNYRATATSITRDHLRKFFSEKIATCTHDTSKTLSEKLKLSGARDRETAYLASQQTETADAKIAGHGNTSHKHGQPFSYDRGPMIGKVNTSTSSPAPVTGKPAHSSSLSTPLLGVGENTSSVWNERKSAVAEDDAVGASAAPQPASQAAQPNA